MHWRQQTNLCQIEGGEKELFGIDLLLLFSWNGVLESQKKKLYFCCLGKKLCLKFAFHEKTVQFQNWFETPRLLHAPGFINFLPEFLSKLTETFLRQICGFASQGFIPSLPKLLSRKSTLASALFPNSTDSPLYLRYLQTNCKVLKSS